MATLKISDLSVGDWVRCGRWNGRIQRIAMHDGETVEVIIKGDCGLLYMYKRIYEINSIPITAEILRRMGGELLKRTCSVMNTNMTERKEYGMMKIAQLTYARRGREYSGTLGVANIICGGWNMSINCNI